MSVRRRAALAALGRVRALAVLLVLLGAASHAHAEDAGPILLGIAVLPSDAGANLAIDDKSRGSALIGWSWQFPFEKTRRHRILAAVDMLPRYTSLSWRSRLAYRYSTRSLFGGIGPSYGNGEGFTATPEVGIRFLHVEKEYDSPEDPIDVSMHALVRTDIGARGFETVSLMLGWNFF